MMAFSHSGGGINPATASRRVDATGLHTTAAALLNATLLNATCEWSAIDAAPAHPSRDTEAGTTEVTAPYGQSCDAVNDET